MLKDLGRKHELWVAMALNMGVPPSLAEDLIQEMYLRLNKYVKDESKIYYKDTGAINRFYIWTTIRNMWVSAIAYKSKNSTIYLEDLSDYSSDSIQVNSQVTYDAKEIEAIEAHDRLFDKVMECVDNWDYWYDQKLFGLYYMSDMSMRDIANKTNISLTSIFNSCKNYKIKINNKLLEDWEDFKNGDFDKI